MKKYLQVLIPLALLLGIAGYVFFTSGSVEPLPPAEQTPGGTSNPATNPSSGSLNNDRTPSQTTSGGETEAPASTSSTEITGIQPDAFMTETGFTDEYKINIHGSKLSEATVTVAKGTVVTWTNYDLDRHRIVANSGAFESDVLETAVPFFLYTSDFTPGIYQYHLADTPDVRGTLIIK